MSATFFAGVPAVPLVRAEEASATEEIVLRVGQSVEGEVSEASPVVHSPTLDSGYSVGPARGVRFVLDVENAGPVTIDLRSCLFDAYLVLEDASGQVIAEDDDGWVVTQSRLVRELGAARYAVLVCALHGRTGAFTLQVVAGASPPLTGPARSAAEIEDATRTVEARETVLGPGHAETATALNNLAYFYHSQGRYAESEPLCLRALRITEALGPNHPQTASTLSNLAGLRYSQGRYAEAERLYLRALKISEAAAGPDHPQTAGFLDNLAELYESQGRHAEAESLCRRALGIYEAVFGPYHPQTAASLDSLAGVFSKQGRLAEAEPLFLRALKTWDAIASPDDPRTAVCINNLAGLYESQGRLAEAERLFLRALKIIEALRGPDDPQTASILNNLAAVSHSQGRYADAEQLHLRSLEIREAALGPSHPDTATSLNNLAHLYYSQGRYVDAERLNLRALEIRGATLGPDHPDTGRSLNNLAALYESQGRYAEAERLFRQALEIWETALGADHPDVASSLNNLAHLYESQRRYAEAEPLYRRALEIHEAALGTDHPHTAISLWNLAGVLQSQGRLTDAEGLYLRALDVMETALGDDHPHTATCLNNLATLYNSQGRSGEAAPLYVRALEVTSAALGDDHPHTAINFLNLANLYQSQGRHADAIPLYVRALDIFEVKHGAGHPYAVTCLDNLAALYWSQGRHDETLSLTLRALDGSDVWITRELLRSANGRRLSIAALQKSNIHRALTVWSLSVGARPALDTVYRRVTAWKGVVFRSASRLARALAAAKGDRETLELRRDLVNLNGQLSVLAYTERVIDPVEHRRQLLDLREQRRRTEQELLTHLGLDPELESTDGAEMSRLLPSGSAVLDFLVHQPWQPPGIQGSEVYRPSRWGDPRLLCFVTVAGAGRPMLVDLGDADTLLAATNGCLDGVSRGSRGVSPGTTLGRVSPGARVRELMLDPLLEVLPTETNRLLVIPDDFVGSIPFGAIPLADGRYLLETMDVAYAPDPISLRDLLEAEPAPARTPPSILAVGGVDYDARSDVSEDIDPSLLSRSELRGGPAAFGREWRSLTNTSVEVDGISKQAAGTWLDAAPDLLSSSAATEEAVKAEAPGHTILHFATHGFFQREGLKSMWQAALERAHDDVEPRGLGAMRMSSDRPSLDPYAGMPALDGEEPGLLAGLVLAGANLDPLLEPDRDDGILTATEVSSLDLSACRLAVLSACQTSVGVGQSGEGLQSLRRGFHEAGADTVIASLWKVDDEATRELMHHFYEELWTSDCGSGEALRRAQRALLRKKETRDPYYWAAFTLSGEWR